MINCISKVVRDKVKVTTRVVYKMALFHQFLK